MPNVSRHVRFWGKTGSGQEGGQSNANASLAKSKRGAMPLRNSINAADSLSSGSSGDYGAMPDRLNHRIAVIAGATRGIGRALVDVLAGQWGASGTVYLTARRAQDGDAAAVSLRANKRNVNWLPFDLDDPQGARRLLTFCMPAMGA